jgi:hypothetical protein
VSPDVRVLAPITRLGRPVPGGKGLRRILQGATAGTLAGPLEGEAPGICRSVRTPVGSLQKPQALGSPLATTDGPLPPPRCPQKGLGSPGLCRGTARQRAEVDPVF